MEFGIISGITDDKIEKIDPAVVNLEYVLVIKIKKKNNQNNILVAKKNLHVVVSLLKVFNEGEISSGGIYYFNSENWCVNFPKKIEGRYHNPSGKLYFLKSNDASRFKKLHFVFQQTLLDIKITSFLKTSIRRFGIAIDDRNHEDKIVDFMISLESLFSAKGIDVQNRMATRVALILGRNIDERIFLFNFIKKAYDVRSRIVHGDEIGTITIDNKIYSLEKLSVMLEDQARKCIKRFPALIHKYDTKEKIQAHIDMSALDARIWRDIHSNK